MNLVTELIPYGHENAITRSELSMYTGLSDREVRRAIIEDADEVIINMADGKGYFRPLPNEIDLVRKYKNSFVSRINEEQKRIEQLSGFIVAAQMCELMCPGIEE